MKEYEGFENWYALYEKYEKANLKDINVRKALIKDFEEVSKLMWECWLKHTDTKEMAEAISEAWCSEINFRSPVRAALEALGYLEFASDRMNINRWMRIRILLNYSIE